MGSRNSSIRDAAGRPAGGAGRPGRAPHPRRAGCWSGRPPVPCTAAGDHEASRAVRGPQRLHDGHPRVVEHRRPVGHLAPCDPPRLVDQGHDPPALEGGVAAGQDVLDQDWPPAPCPMARSESPSPHTVTRPVPSWSESARRVHASGPPMISPVAGSTTPTRSARDAGEEKAWAIGPVRPDGPTDGVCREAPAGPGAKRSPMAAVEVRSGSSQRSQSAFSARAADDRGSGPAWAFLRSVGHHGEADQPGRGIVGLRHVRVAPELVDAAHGEQVAIGSVDEEGAACEACPWRPRPSAKPAIRTNPGPARVPVGWRRPWRRPVWSRRTPHAR